jgi:hypothetical protein
MRRELFVYYRVLVGQEAAARAEVHTFQATLRCSHPQLLARLLVREAPPGISETWMETYAMVSTGQPQGVDAELQAAIEAQALSAARFIDGARHLEVFIGTADA